VSRNDYGKNSPNNGGKQSDTGGRSKEPDENANIGNGQVEPQRFIAPTPKNEDIIKLLSELEAMVERAPKVMGAMLRFDDEFFHMTLMKIRANLPEELKRASKAVKDSEQIISETRNSTDKMLTEARRTAKEEIANAKLQADKLVQETMAKLDKERAACDDYIATERANLAEDVAKKMQETLDEAASILNEARAQAALVISDSEIVRAAEAEANEIRLQAHQDAYELREGAKQYATDVLAHIYDVLDKASTEVVRGQQALTEQE
jgi:vacuolar-type H+-ATPase subunit H